MEPLEPQSFEGTQHRAEQEEDATRVIPKPSHVDDNSNNAKIKELLGHKNDHTAELATAEADVTSKVAELEALEVTLDDTHEAERKCSRSYLAYEKAKGAKEKAKNTTTASFGAKK